MTKLTEIHSHGVSIWLDDLSRARITSGDLAAWQQKGVRGVTTNPSIFKAAITQGAQSEYGADLERLRSDGATAEQIVRELTVQDVQAACDVFMPTYRESEIDGRVSLEVDPRLAHDGDTTLSQAIELHKLVNRPNVMIKIPATKASIPAITGAIANGISVNVTLIFSIERYAEVIQAWLLGLEQAKERGIDLSTISSVASFFVSPSYDPLMYVTGLVAPNTVNTLPQGTLNALYEYSGQLADTVSQSYPDATDVMLGLADLGVSISKVLTELETVGVKAFVDAWTDLLTAVESN